MLVGRTWWSASLELCESDKYSKYHAFLGAVPRLLLWFCYRDGGDFEVEEVGLATTLVLFLVFSPSGLAVLSASWESLAEFTSLSEKMLRSCSFTSRYSKSCSYVFLMCRWSI